MRSRLGVSPGQRCSSQWLHRKDRFQDNITPTFPSRLQETLTSARTGKLLTSATYETDTISSRLQLCGGQMCETQVWRLYRSFRLQEMVSFSLLSKSKCCTNAEQTIMIVRVLGSRRWNCTVYERFPRCQSCYVKARVQCYNTTTKTPNWSCC